MKKVLSVLLCIIMTFSFFTVAVSAAETEESTPIILVTGFLQTHLYSEEDGEKTSIWFPDIINAVKSLRGRLTDIITSVFSLFLGNPEHIGDALGSYVGSLFSDLKYLPDGSSEKPVRHYENDPAKRNVASFGKNGNENKLNAYSVYLDYICNNGYADAENVFTFEYDGRADAITIADELRDFIKAVKEYTGKSKVTLLGVSYGGQIIETYLHYYRNELDVKKAVLCVPSLKGTNFSSQFLLGKVELALDDVIDFVESVIGSDIELYNLVRGVDPDRLSRAINAASVYAVDVVKNWSSVYSLSTTESYEEIKDAFLDPVYSAEIIEKNDIIHYEIMPEIENTLRDCEALGIDISITACSGIELCFGGGANSDLLLAVDDTTGAYCTLMGERFSDGYSTKGTSCGISSHNHLSPEMNIDASTAYLPESTWFIDGSYHAMFQYEDYGMELMAKLVCTDELKDVHSNPEFPQFVCSDNPHRGIYGEFDSSTSGYLNSRDKYFVIENKFKNSPVIITDITVKGIDIAFPENIDVTLKPGETAEISFTGDVPEISAAKAEITVNYLKLDDAIMYSRDFAITINNGQPQEYDAEIIEDEYFNGKNTSPFPPLKKLILSFIYPVKIVVFVLNLLNPFAK